MIKGEADNLGGRILDIYEERGSLVILTNYRKFEFFHNGPIDSMRVRELAEALKAGEHRV